MSKSKKQASFDFGMAQVRSIPQIAASLDLQSKSALESVDFWPQNAFCLYGENESGHSILAKDFAKNHEIKIINDAHNCDEQSLLNDLVDAEAGRIKLLLLSDSHPKNWNLQSADLASRVKNLSCHHAISANKDVAKQILTISLKEAGLFLQQTDIEYAISNIICNFVTISQIFHHIMLKLHGNMKPRKDDIKNIIDEFINANGTKDLFDEPDNRKNND